MLVCESSGLKSADAQILTGSGQCISIIAIGDGTNEATIDVYDGTSSSGTLIAKIVVDAGAVYESFSPSYPIQVTTGIYLDVTGTGAKAVVHFSRG
jgi:hypothetical protein